MAIPENYVAFDPNAQAALDEEYIPTSAFFKWAVGFNVIRILPAHPNAEGRIWLPVWQHFVPSHGGQNGGTYVCPAKQFGRRANQPCPICDAVLRAERDGGDKKKVSKGWSNLSFGANILPLTVAQDPTTGHTVISTEGVKKLFLSRTLRGMIWNPKDKSGRPGGIAYADKLNPEASFINFVHPDEGRNILVEKKEASPWWHVEFYGGAWPLDAIQGAEHWYEELYDISQDIVVQPIEALKVAAAQMYNFIMGAGGRPQQPAMPQQPALPGQGVLPALGQVQQAQVTPAQPAATGGVPNAFTKLG